MIFVFLSLATGHVPDPTGASSYSSNGVCLLSLTVKREPGFVSKTVMQEKDSAGHCRGFQKGQDGGLPTLQPLAEKRGAKMLLEADATPEKCEELCLADNDCRFFSLWSGGNDGPQKAVCASFKYCKETQKSEGYQTWRKRRTKLKKTEEEDKVTPSPTEPEAEEEEEEEEETYYSSEEESYYSEEESYYSSEEEAEVTPSP